MSKAEKKIEGFHPKQHVVNVLMTDGTKFQIMSSWGKEGDTLRLDTDPKNHVAWQEKGQASNAPKNERIAKFKEKFGDFSFGAKVEEAKN